MNTDFHLQKFVWDENDFDQMGWHDNKIYAIAFNEEKFELAFDIDYITKWVDPNEKDTFYKFWVAPATLVFKNVYDINLKLNSIDFQIEDISRSNPTKPKNTNISKNDKEYDWSIETTSGEITFKSIGYTQYFRSAPILSESQKLNFKDRGRISFETNV